MFANTLLMGSLCVTFTLQAKASAPESGSTTSPCTLALHAGRSTGEVADLGRRFVFVYTDVRSILMVFMAFERYIKPLPKPTNPVYPDGTYRAYWARARVCVCMFYYYYYYYFCRTQCALAFYFGVSLFFPILIAIGQTLLVLFSFFIK